MDNPILVVVFILVSIEWLSVGLISDLIMKCIQRLKYRRRRSSGEDQNIKNRIANCYSNSYSNSNSTIASRIFPVDDVVIGPDVEKNILRGDDLDASYLSKCMGRMNREHFDIISYSSLTKSLNRLGDARKMILPGNFYNKNAFISGAIYAYVNHYPFIISPDHIWQLIITGLARHVEDNSMELSQSIIGRQFDGNKIRLNYCSASSKINWKEVISSLTRQVEAKTVPEVKEIILAKFSTSTELEQTALRIALLDICKHYFEYRVTVSCGIPNIILLGTREDWQSIYDRASRLHRFMTPLLGKAPQEGKTSSGPEGMSSTAGESPDLVKFWLQPLLKVLDEFIDPYKSPNFWPRMLKWNKEKSFPYTVTNYINGWINVFMPFTKKMSGEKNRLNPYLEEKYWNPDCPGFIKDNQGLCVNLIPNALATAPIDLNNSTVDVYGGFVGISQSPITRAVYPEIGWFVTSS